VSRLRRLDPIRPWGEFTATRTDWAKPDPSLLRAMLARLHLIRAFEETVLELAGDGLVHGPAHSSIGQEGTRPSSKRTSTASSTRTAASPAAPSATAPSRRRQPGANATPS
jgi:hypothetical protein